ncbi:hypothetical protein RVR_P225 (plasmid) [Actinacidiphila reveromycinica]|uniref:Uncharacterized protein n=1 Tax=Actinacidiphila reveromycinica TaxID=659352 RepID=A0A7R6QIJ1_9ACTN|nr:hypothetical protein [Streptomyces sp. SN-593]BBG20768.1 hypothetical protein RVR_P225 [Streptomyces sp. SN-593]
MSPTPSSYHARAVLKSGGIWQAVVDELPEVRPAHRSLSQLDTRLRQAIADQHGVPKDSVLIRRDTAQGNDEPTDTDGVLLLVTISTGDTDLDARIAEARTMRLQADQLALKARELATPLAEQLVRKKGVSTRDAGSLLGISAATVSIMTSTT